MQVPGLDRWLAPDDAARPASATEPVPSSDEASGELLDGVVRRAFDGDPDRLRRFVACLRTGLPPCTRIALRGSAVGGASYLTGEPFDGSGYGTSDLDVVVIGDEAMNLFSAESFYVPGVNTRPLCDGAAWVAPGLDPVRTRAQSLVRRPVAIQAMAGWFLDVRAAVQAQPHVFLDDVPPS